MGIISQLLLGMIHLAFVGMDVLAFFLVLRLLSGSRGTGILAGFNEAGRPLVKSVSDRFGAAWARLFRRDLPEPRRLVVALLVVSLVRLAFSSLIRFG